MVELKKEVEFHLEEFIRNEMPKIYLVGAGCSVDSPSCLPDGRTMIETIVKYTCNESELNKIMELLPNLRFETIIEIIRDILDPNLKLIDYYGICDKPNLLHFFLAETLKAGHYVITTNFDFLIEQALLKIGVSPTEIFPVITKEDFEKFQEPIHDKVMVIKIHGSIKNFITNEDTRQSLIATIQAFGSNKEGLNIFQIEPFKQALFSNLTKNRSLIVMGYSGSDDFDIIPTLKILKNLTNIIWIAHRTDLNEKIRTYELNFEPDKSIIKFDKIDQILLQIKRLNESTRVLRVDADTKRLFKKLQNEKIPLASDKFSLTPIDWFHQNIKKPTQIQKNLITYYIYMSTNQFDEAQFYAEELLKLAIQSNDESHRATTLNKIGNINLIRGNYSKALENFQEAFLINEKLGMHSKTSFQLQQIGLIFTRMANYSKALEMYEKALKLVENSGSLQNKASILSGFAHVYFEQGKYSDAYKYLLDTLKIDQELGNLQGQAATLSNIGLIYTSKGKFEEALTVLYRALKIQDLIGDLEGKTASLNDIGLTYEAQGDYYKAIDYFRMALDIARRLDAKAKIALYLRWLGRTYSKIKGFTNMIPLKYLRESLAIYRELGLQEQIDLVQEVINKLDKK